MEKQGASFSGKEASWTRVNRTCVDASRAVEVATIQTELSTDAKVVVLLFLFCVFGRGTGTGLCCSGDLRERAGEADRTSRDHIE